MHPPSIDKEYPISPPCFRCATCHSDRTGDGLQNALIHQELPQAEIWLGEGGGTGCSEGPATHQMASNEAVDMYWWLDALGSTAVHGHQRFLRETLAGGWYGLTNLTSMQVYPDYYAALLFSRLMGPIVLSADVAQTPKPAPSSPIRAYAHCHRTKGLSILLINLGTTANVTLADHLGRSLLPVQDISLSDDGIGSQYEVYRLAPPAAAAGGQTSHSVQLNGQILELGVNGALPRLLGESALQLTVYRGNSLLFASLTILKHVSIACDVLQMG